MQWTVGALVVLTTLAASPPPLTVRVSGAQPGAVVAPKASPGALALYGERCALCHGVSGAGDGPAAKGLMTKPRRFSDAVWQDDVDDAHIAKAILSGGFAVKKSAAMPSHPDLAARVAELVTVVRSFRSAAGTVRVDAVDATGKVVASATSDVDKTGCAAITLPVPDGAYEIIARASGRKDEVCRATAGVGTRDVACAPTTTAASTPGTATAPTAAP